MGYSLQGMTIRGVEAFNSIPGLRLWIDGRYNITVDLSGRITNVIDLSENSNNFSSATPNRRALHYLDKWIRCIGIDGSIVALRDTVGNYNYLNDGSPFGCYGILNWLPPGSPNLLNNLGASTQSGTTINFDSSVSNGRINCTVRNAGVVVRSVSVNNILVVGHANELIFPNVYTWSTLFTGPNITNNQRIRIHDLETISTDTSLLAEYAALASNPLAIGVVSSLTNFYDCGLTVSYDWTGFSEAEIIDFDIRVRLLVEQQKSNFL